MITAVAVSFRWTSGANSAGLFQMFVQEANDLVAVKIDPRLFAEGVMAAGYGCLAVFYLVFFQRLHSVARKVNGKAQVIKGIDITLRARFLRR